MYKILKWGFFASVIVFAMTSCSPSSPEGVVDDVYSSAHEGKYSKILPYIVPDSIGEFSSKEKEQFDKLMREVMPDTPLYASYEIEQADAEPDKAGNYNFTVKTAFPDGLTYVEKGVLYKDKNDKWKILLKAAGDTVPGYSVTDKTKKSGELLRNLEYAYDLVLSSRGLPEFQLKAADHYYDSVFVARDLNKYFTLVKAAADKGYARAFDYLGGAYLNGKGTEKSDSKAFEAFKEGAAKGDAGSMVALAECYEKGTGTTQDYIEAVKWYQKAVDLGDLTAMNNLSIMYEDGHGVVKDVQKAFDLQVKAADLGNDASMYFIADQYFYGNPPVQKDVNKAIEWFTKAAEKGNPWAMDDLGNIYYYGNGVPVDYSKAFNWYQKKVEQGDISGYDQSKESLANSFFMLGECYEYGRGTSKDLVKAKESYLNAAKYGKKEGETRAKRL